MSPVRLADFSNDDSSYLEFMDGETSLDLDTSYLDAMSSKYANASPQNGQHKRKGSDSQYGDVEDLSPQADSHVKVPKKPGRKPIVDEQPPTKRKVQNRAAQRAFRERKEQHVHDLETKVQELTKTSEKNKQVNKLLQIQLARLETELREYRARSVIGSNRTHLYPSNPAYSGLPPAPGSNNNIVFGSPGFGNQPLSLMSSTDMTNIPPSDPTRNPPSLVPFETNGAIADNQEGIGEMYSRVNQVGSSDVPGTQSQSQAPYGLTSNPITQSPNSIDEFAGLFGPSPLNTGLARTDTNNKEPSLPQTHSPPQDGGTDTNGGLSRVFRFNSGSGSTASHNESTSSLYHSNAESSSYTSPASYATDSPPKTADPYGLDSVQPKDTFDPTSSSFLPGNANGFDWLVSQNNGQFDPVLFGDYRESQDAIIGDGDFNNGFFNDAFLSDGASPFNLDGVTSQEFQAGTPAVGGPVPTSLIEQVERQRDGIEKEAVSDPASLSSMSDPYLERMMKCDKLREQLKNKQLFKDGKLDFDLDSLCGDLKAKAVCSETGKMLTEPDMIRVIEDFFDSHGSNQEQTKPVMKSGS